MGGPAGTQSGGRAGVGGGLAGRSRRAGEPQKRADAVSTIERRLSSLTWNYAQRGQPLDRKDRHIATVLAGIRNSHARPPLQKEAILPEDLIAMLETLDRGTLRGLRDRAMLLLGFAGGLRRSEIVGLDCGRDQTEDGRGWVEILDKGVLVTLRGKTGWREVEIGRGSSDATCPVVALQTWLKLRPHRPRPAVPPRHRPGQAVGAERLNDQEVARLVKRTALAAGVRGDLSEGERGEKFCRPFVARRPRLLGRGRRALCAEAARPRLGRDDPQIPAPARSLPGQSHQGERAVEQFQERWIPAFREELRKTKAASGCPSP